MEIDIEEEIKKHAANLKKSYEKLRRLIKDDQAKSTSTMLHTYRRWVDELRFERLFLLQIGAIHPQTSIYLKDAFEKDFSQILHDRMQQRIKWQARFIDDTINHMKNKGAYKDEFTTDVILANAYNDIFQDQFRDFIVKEGENK